MVRAAGILSYRFLPADSGGRKAIALFYRYFSRELSLTCFTTRDNGTDADANYTQERLFTTSSLRYLNPAYFFIIRRQLRQQAVTHLLLDHPYYGWLAIILKRSTGVKLVLRSHNIEGQRFKLLGKFWWPLLAAYEKWVHRQGDYHFFITDEDRQYAERQFGLSPSRCATITYGITQEQAPPLAEKQAAAATLRARYQIAEDSHVFLFNGIFDYAPNAAALELLVREICPLLIQAGISFTLLICGRAIPAHVNNQQFPFLHVAGFVDDIELYLSGADLFLNPITQGGGIKTKLVEALASGTTCVSFPNGGIGIPASVTGNKLHIAKAATNPNAFAEAVKQALPAINDELPATFFAHFNWQRIAAKAAAFINS